MATNTSSIDSFADVASSVIPTGTKMRIEEALTVIREKYQTHFRTTLDPQSVFTGISTILTSNIGWQLVRDGTEYYLKNDHPTRA
mgnify:CR=1 FL=1